MIDLILLYSAINKPKPFLGPFMGEINECQSYVKIKKKSVFPSGSAEKEWNSNAKNLGCYSKKNQYAT